MWYRPENTNIARGLKNDLKCTNPIIIVVDAKALSITYFADIFGFW